MKRAFVLFAIGLVLLAATVVLYQQPWASCPAAGHSTSCSADPTTIFLALITGTVSVLLFLGALAAVLVRGRD